jgi:hypothetical protein
MSRTISLVVIAAALGGFAAGWMAFDTGTAAPAPPAAAAVAPATAAATEEAQPASPVAARHRFALRPEDARNDRETPAIASDARGRVVLAWASQEGEAERTLYLARSSDGGATFSPPAAWRKVPIYRFSSKSKGREMAFSTHVLPRLAAGGDALYLGWVEAIDGGPEVAYFVAKSTDGGATFSEPARVHGPEAGRPGFTTLAVGPDGSVQCAWLDGRAKAQQPYTSARPSGEAAFQPERLVYEGPDGRGICPCCDLAVARGEDGSEFVAFRNSDSGHRDIYVARSPAGSSGFEPPVPVSSARWAFDGCPHDGPSLALAGGRLRLLWMDAHTGKDRVYCASASPSALDFVARELNPRSPVSQGHPKLAVDAKGTQYAVWDEALGADASPAPEAGKDGHGHGRGPSLGGSGRAIMFASAAGDDFGPATPIAPRPGAFQIQPSIAVGPDGAVYAAWNELDTDGKGVVFVRLKPAAGESL